MEPLFSSGLPRAGAGWYNICVDFDNVERAFCEELHKIGASNMHVPQTRSGRRSISVDNLLKKDNQGKLFKHAPKPAHEAEAASNPSL